MMPLTISSFLQLVPLNPLLARQRLIEAVEAGTVTFPKGTTEQSLLPWLWHSEVFYLEEADKPDTIALVERYGIYRQPLDAEIPFLTGFPLTSVLELLARIAQGEHPRFNERIFEMLNELIDQEFSPWEVDILFHDSPQ